MKRKRSQSKGELNGAERLLRVLNLFNRYGDRSNIPNEELMEGRSCGSCNVCCVSPGIRPIDLTEEEAKLCPPKMPDTPCVNCTNNGCAIYDKRPTLCREYECTYLCGITDERPDTTSVCWVIGDNSDTQHLEGGLHLTFQGQCADVRKALDNPVVRHQIRMLATTAQAVPVCKIILTDHEYQVGFDLTGRFTHCIGRQDYSDPYAPNVNKEAIKRISVPWLPDHLFLTKKPRLEISRITTTKPVGLR